MIRHGLLLVHLLVCAVLLPGLMHRTGTAFLPEMAIYFSALLGAHILLQRLAYREPTWSLPWHIPIPYFLKAALLVQVFMMAGYWITLGEVPLLTALGEQDDLLIVSIRNAAGTTVPTWLHYAMHLQLKAVIPVALVIAWSADRRLFWVLSLVSGAFAASLLAKSFVITLFVPLWVAFLLRRRWIAFITLCATFLVLTVGLSWAANPQKFRTVQATEGGAQAVPEDKGVREHGLVGDAIVGVGKRLIRMPGGTVAAWFTHIPADIAFCEGGAVRPLAILLGVPYRDLSTEIYALEYPDLAAKGVPGTMGTASFMHGYANFGRWGLFGSGVITALMLALARTCFGREWRWAVVLNVFPLLSLSGAALPTVLLTHGWALTLILFLLLRPTTAPAE